MNIEKVLNEMVIDSSNTKLNLQTYDFEDGLEIYQVANGEERLYNVNVSKDSIIFLYSPEDEIGLDWPDHNQAHILNPVQILTYAYPLKDTEIKISQKENSQLYIVRISIERLHVFFGSNFGSDQDETQSFLGSFRMRNVYSEKPVTPTVSILFHQIFNNDHQGLLKRLFIQGKFMEFLSVYMQQPKNDEKLSLQCSFVNDHLEMNKIKEARNIIIRELADPPNLKDLAHMVGTNEFKLKVGFKSMFGNTVYGYLNDFKMDKARNLLDQRCHSVKEVSNIIGYSNPSHFIAAYKKKFGITPKKYLMALN